MELIKVFRARVVDVAPESLIIEVSARGQDRWLLEVFGFCVLEMARTGRISMTAAAICCSHQQSG